MPNFFKSFFSGKSETPESKCQETTYYDADSCPVQEGFCGHRCSYRQSEEDSSRIHDAIGSSVEQAERVGSDFFHQVTEHQHSNQWHSTWYEESHNSSYHNREDNLQDTEVLDFRL